MKLKLTLLLAIFSFILFYQIDKSGSLLHFEQSELVAASDSSLEEGDGFTLSQADNSIDLFVGRVDSLTISLSHTLVNRPVSRQGGFNSLERLRLVSATISPMNSYIRSANFPYNHKPQRELFFTLCNLRI